MQTDEVTRLPPSTATSEAVTSLLFLAINYEAYGNVKSTEAKALAQISVLILSPSLLCK